MVNLEEKVFFGRIDIVVIPSSFFYSMCFLFIKYTNKKQKIKRSKNNEEQKTRKKKKRKDVVKIF